MSAPLTLSVVKPDFDSILLQLQIYLEETGSWSDLKTSSTGQTLLEMMSAVGAMNQFAIESAVRETTLTTAARDSSVYAITRMLGVRVHRKSPARVTTNLSRKTSLLTESLPTLTQFDINGIDFFNRHQIMFAQGSLNAAEILYYGSAVTVVSQMQFKLDYSIVLDLGLITGEQFSISITSGPDTGQVRQVVYTGGNVGNSLFTLVAGQAPFTSLTTTTRFNLMRDTVTLYEGKVIEEVFTSDGSAFQQYYLSNKRFSVADVDVEVRVFSESLNAFVLWTVTTDGLWVSGPQSEVYFDSTSGAGEAIITFGDGITGVSPKLGSGINIKYAVTTGAKANNGLTNLNVVLPTVNGVEGTTVSVISNGADEKPASYYRVMAPLIFKARNRGVTSIDYKAVALDYPGIISVSVQAQRDIAPTDLRWMNQIQVCLLPSADGVYALTLAEWKDFMDYMDKRKHAAVNLIAKDPTRQFCEIDVTLAIKKQYISSSVIPKAEAAIRTLFNRQSDTLGRRITVSDVTRVAYVEGVDYVVINRCMLSGTPGPIDDLVPVDNTHFLEITQFTVNTKYSEREVQ